MYRDTTNIGEKRTAEQVAETANSIRRDFLIEQGINFGMVACFAALFFSVEVLANVALFALLVVFIGTKFASGWLNYRDALFMNEQTLDCEKMEWNDELVSFIDSMCVESNVQPPRVASSGWLYAGEYDAAEAEICLGCPIMDYATESAYAVAAHEAGRHIQMTDPKSARKNSILVKVSRVLRWAPWAILAGAVASMFAGSENIGIFLVVGAVIYALSYAVQSIYEKDATKRAIRFLFTSETARKYVSDMGRARKTLYMSLATYYAEAVGWTVFAFAILAAAGIRGLF